jgi:hypothetical protein
MKKFLLTGLILCAFTQTAFADIQFLNGGFEDGDLNGWTLGSQDYYGTTYGASGTGLTVWSPGTNGGEAVKIMNAGNDPNVNIKNYYNGSNAARIGDSLAWGYNGGGNIYNWISQTATVTGATPGKLYFAWAAVLEESGHPYSQTPFFEVKITKNGTSLIYDYLKYEKDGGFWTDTGYWRYSTGNYASWPGWYVEELDLAALGVNVGDSLTLDAIARDCTPSAHSMYIYLDGFGGAPPPPPVPEPSTVALLGLGLAGIAVMGKRMRK